MNLLSNLNPAQIKAVTHREGPLMIVAGAGTGKTTVITRRIAWLIEQGLAKPEEILALTFTDKASGEMEERVDLLLPYGYVDLQISTFHAFCERLLRDHGVHIGLSPDFELVTELDAWLLARQQFDRFELDYYRPLGNPTKYLKSLLQHFSRAKDAAITPDTYLAFADGKKADTDLEIYHEELARAYHTYQQILLERDSLDFGDLILYTLQLLRDRPKVLARIQKQYPFILVDEFQDTNHAQYELVRLIAGEKQNLTVVGDDDQAIYKFRGASIENILRFQTDYPTATQVVLTHNYRSTQSILDHAYTFIQKNNPNRLEIKANLSKKLLASSEEQGMIEHIHCATSEEEVRAVLEKILELKDKSPDVTWSDFVILVRSNGAGADFAAVFDLSNIPFQFLALSGLYQKPVILNSLALLRVIDQPHDSPSLYRVLNMPLWEINAVTIAELNRLATRKGKSLSEAITLAKGFSPIEPEQLSKLDEVLRVLSTLRQESQKLPVTELYLRAVKESGYMEYLNRLDERLSHESFGFLQQFFERLKSFESRADHITLHEFLEEFQHERDAGEEGSLNVDLDAGPDMVRIMTIHGAKGLEFRYVFVVNLVDRKFPTQRRGDAIPVPQELLPTPETDEAEFHLAEERRLFYVAMTRAKEGLFFTSADNYGGARDRKLSRFLDELGYTKPNEQSKNVFELWDQDQEPPEQRKEAWDVKPYLPKQFSFTQLAAFKTCPLQYKFAHILKVPVLGKWTFSFGKTMHNTLHRYFTAWMEQTGQQQTSLFATPKKTASGELVVSLEELFEIYKTCWQDDWYPNDETREKYRAQGRAQLIAYTNSFDTHPPNPLSLEQGFTYKIGDVIIKGRIDRIDRCEDGVEIIDYKTGKPKTTLEKADKEQLWLYQLAARDVLRLNPKKLTFVYLEDGSHVSFLGTEKELDRFQEDVVERVSSIRQSQFLPTPGFHCRFCDFADICEFRE